MNRSQAKSVQDLLKGLSQAFSEVRDPRVDVLAGIPDSIRLPGALLATVLGQDMKIGSLAKLLSELHSRMGDRLLRIETGDWDELQRASRFGWLAEWPHRESLAGWILSVSDFLRAHGSPENWLAAPTRPGEIVESMARELPWMGSRSPSKVKGWRLVRWLVRGELGGAIGEPAERRSLKLPVAAVERPLRTLGWLPTGWAESTVGKKQEWFDALLAKSLPEDPAGVWVPLETVLARGRSGPACQEHLGACSKCPVRSSCPSPGRT